MWASDMFSATVRHGLPSDGWSQSISDRERNRVIDETRGWQSYWHHSTLAITSRRPPLIMHEHAAQPFLGNDGIERHNVRGRLRKCTRQRRVFCPCENTFPDPQAEQQYDSRF